MSHLSFWAGLAVGVLSTLAAGAALWYGMLHYLRGMDPVDLGVVATSATTAAEGIHRVATAISDTHEAFLDVSERCLLCGSLGSCEHSRPVCLPVGEDDPPDPLPLPTRGPTTDYSPYSTHHDLVATEWPDGTVTYSAPASHVYDRATGQHLCCADDPPDPAGEGIG